ncbi:MAG: T9SS type A sorting domain-containing protein, partial [Chlorobi bacterium]|nr:T9SS type A sorting domain-containing protein [Chlorobiota bacterium]
IDVNAEAVVNDIVFGLPGYYYFYPAVAVSGTGDVLITFSRSSLEDYASSYFAFIPVSTGLPDKSYILNQGASTYEKTFGSGRNRWGDYNGAWTDPADNNVFWVHTEYVFKTNKWGNSVAGIRARPFETAFAYQINKDLEFGVANRYNDGETIRTRVANLGNTQLNLTAADFGSDNFKISGVVFPVAIDPFDTLDIPIVFNPKDLGVISDSLTLATNDVNKPELKVYLQGQGFSIAVKGTMYAVTGRGTGSHGKLLSIDPSSGAGTSLGESGIMPLRSVVINPSDTSLYALNTTVFTPSLIVKLNAFDGKAFEIIETEIGVNAIIFDADGTLYGLGKDNKLYTIDLETGSASEIGDIGFKVSAGTINPADGILWVSSGESSGKGDIFTVDKATGLATQIGNAGLNETIYSLGFDDNGKLYGTTGNEFSESVFYEISTTDGSATQIGPVGEKGVLGLVYARDGVVSVERENEDEAVPVSFALKQNYPNPFNPTTVIRYSVPSSLETQNLASQPVNLKVFDILGKEITTLVNEQQSAGNYSVTFNAANLPSGIYFYSLSIGGQRATKKMVLLR